jgi:hypothetical protein
MRSYYKGIARDQYGAIISGATVAIYLAGTTTVASVYTVSTGGTAVNSVTADAEGVFYFYVDTSDYSNIQLFKLVISYLGNTNTYDNISAFYYDNYYIDALGEYGSGTAYTQSTIEAALTAIGTTNKATMLLRPGTWAVTANLTIPANVTLKIPAGAVLSVATGKTLTINGSFEAGLYQVFDCVGTGAVVFGSGVYKVYPQWWGATGAGTDDTVAIQAASDCAQSSNGVLYFPRGSYMISDSIEITRNGTNWEAAPAVVTETTSIYASTNVPILYFNRAAGTVARCSFTYLMFVGQTNGAKSGTTNYNTEPLIYFSGGTIYSVKFQSCDIRRGTVGMQGTVGYLKLIDCSLLGNLTFFSGVSSRHFYDNCDIENNTIFIDNRSSTGGAVLVINNSYFESSGTSYINTPGTVISNSSIYATSFVLSKETTNFNEYGNTWAGGTLQWYPRFDNHINTYYQYMGNVLGNIISKKIPNLSPYSQISTDYVTGDSLDYLIATQITRTVTTAATLTVEFDVGGVAANSDDIDYYKTSGYLGTNRKAMTTFGTVLNDGASIGVTAAGASYNQVTSYIQSLLTFGTFPGGVYTPWFNNGSCTISHDGTYLRVIGGSSFYYNRVLHLPNTEILIMLARVKSGSTGTLGYGYTHYKLYDFFDNGDGTYDDLWVNTVKVKPFEVKAKGTVVFAAISAGTGNNPLDVYIKWVAAIPLMDNADKTIYSNTFTYDPASVGSGAAITATIMADGNTSNDFKQANVGDAVLIHPPYDLQGLVLNGYVNATGQITMRLYNPTAGAIDLASGTWRWELIKQ